MVPPAPVLAVPAAAMAVPARGPRVARVVAVPFTVGHAVMVAMVVVASADGVAEEAGRWMTTPATPLGCSRN